MRFDALTQPLLGTHLLEASAGTGKTYAITSLVLRLLLGHAGGRTGCAPRSLGEILIVTFTRAATEELRGRIRRRIQQARRVFAGEETAGDDELLAALLAASTDRARDVGVLQIAEHDMDLAAICTIHGFAQRVLARNAFESGALLAADIDPSDAQLRDETVLDAWREHVYPQAAVVADLLAAAGCDLEGFRRTLGLLIGRPDTVLESVPAADWATLTAQAGPQARDYVAAWRDDPALQDALRALPLKAEARRKLDTVLDALDAPDAAAGGAVLDAKSLRLLDATVLARELLKKGAAAGVAPNPLFEHAAGLLEFATRLAARLVADTLPQVRRRLQQLKDGSGRLGYDDLLRLVDEGLAGAGGERLAEVVRTQFPVAFIDEFQDTDPLQYRVFTCIWARGSGALFMVGDPKQAIYAFRGADVHAYLQARRGARDPAVLDTNRRSVAPLVDAVNAIFELRGDRDPFLGGADLPFAPVLASGVPERKPLLLDGKPLPALQVLHAGGGGKPPSVAAHRALLAALAAHHLHAVLDAAATGRATLGGRPLEAGDIAILVRDRHEAKALGEELARRGIPWVYTSRDSVLASPLARQLHQLLVALLDPADARAVLAARALPLFRLSAAEIEALAADERELAAAQQDFFERREMLRRLGPQAALRALLFAADVPARLLAEAGGERELTDLLHLVELLQAEREQLDGDAALPARLAALIASPDGENEAQQLRLESDARRVQIVTLHRSKGLEYPLVYLPFAAGFREARDALYHDPQTLQSRFDLAGGETARELADRERLAEEVRLLYVGLTRAQHGLVLGLADIVRGNRNQSEFGMGALGHVLGEGNDAAAAHARLLGCAGVAAAATPPELPPLRTGTAGGAGLQARRFTRRIETDWRATSYSALLRAGEESHAPAFRQPELAGDAGGGERGFDLFGFRRGARHGSFLHRVLERIDYALPADAPATQALLRRELGLGGYDARFLPALTGMVDAVLHTPLDGANLRLGALGPQQRVVEMEFALPLAPLDAPRVNALLQAHEPLAREAAALAFPAMHGMLAGFIDLVFEHEGRFHVADFKSNHLGNNLEDYAPDRLAASMTEHRYDLQYALYSVALVRLLRARLGAAFRFEQHVGGVYYLYLRGLRRSEGPRYGVFHARPPAALIDGLDALFAGSTHGR